MNPNEVKVFSSIVVVLSTLVVFLIALIPALPFLSNGELSFEDFIPLSEFEKAERTDFFKRDFDVTSLSNSNNHQKIKYGYDIITNTPNHLGPNSSNPKAGNNLSCTNCHLDAGTKAFAAPYVGITKRFPQFRKREGKLGTIEDRINGCMERSMNGVKLSDVSPEMLAMVAYMDWLGHGIPNGFEPKGIGFINIQIPNRRVNLKHGELVYKNQCASCHGSDGQGLRSSKGGYTYPPLWGKDSYNHGAGMNRVLTAANFIKANMPFGATAEEPILTDEEAFDVAGYIDSFERPLKKDCKGDFPDLKLKPVSTPYGPVADNFPIDQHKYGPFPEIIEYYKTNFGIHKSK